MRPKRVAILISGSGSNMAALIAAMRKGQVEAEPVLVISNRAEAGGLALARQAGVPVQAIASAGRSREDFEAELAGRLNQTAPDLICLAGFMRVLTPGFAGHWQGKMINIHPSLLPKYTGLHTHARALAAGDAEHGASTHWVTPDLDGGPVIGQVRIRVLPGDTAEALAARLLPQEHRLYTETLRRLAAGETAPFRLP